MKYVGLDLHKKAVFATVLGGDGKILKCHVIVNSTKIILPGKIPSSINTARPIGCNDSRHVTCNFTTINA